jgi:hypothetical protein
MCTALSRSTFDPGAIVHLIDIPCCSGSTSTLRRGLGGATSEKQLRRRPTGLGPQDAGCQQVCSHRPSDLILPAHVCWWTPQPRSVDSTESTLVARAGVYRSARLWARWNRAALLPRVVPLKLGYRARKRVVWASGHKRLRVRCQGHCWPSGRSGAGWGRSQGLPWVGGGLGGALRRQGRRSSRGRLSRAYPPWAASPRSSAWRGGGVKIGKIYGTVFFRLRIV